MRNACFNNLFYTKYWDSWDFQHACVVGMSGQTDLHLESGDPDKMKGLILEDYQMQSISVESLNTTVSQTNSRLILNEK